MQLSGVDHGAGTHGSNDCTVVEELSRCLRSELYFGEEETRTEVGKLARFSLFVRVGSLAHTLPLAGTETLSRLRPRVSAIDSVDRCR